MQECNNMSQTGATLDPGVEANARLTGSIAVVLLALLAADFATGLLPFPTPFARPSGGG